MLQKKYYVELLHPVPGKTVTLHSSSTLADAHSKWKEAARSLNLPAIEDTPIGRITRQPDDLNKSIRALLSESKVPGFLEDVTQPPPRVLVTRNGETFHIVVRPPWVTWLVASLFCFGLGGLFYYFFHYMLGNDSGGLVAGLMGLCGLAFLSFISVSQDIVVTPSMITSYTRTPIGKFGRKSIPLNDIHSVMWVGKRMFTGINIGYLCLASYGTEISIPMNSELANWIGRFVMTAAAKKLPGQ
jgi:hypothetical protein